VRKINSNQAFQNQTQGTRLYIRYSEAFRRYL
jgi:hypothetical protein